jgi:hypothetical protein
MAASVRRPERHAKVSSQRGHEVYFDFTGDNLSWIDSEDWATEFSSSLTPLLLN